MENISDNHHPSQDIREKITRAFVQHVLENGLEPTSVYSFTQTLGIPEDEFYTYFNSFEEVKGAVWEQIMQQTIALVQAQEVYQGYTAQEKLLSFYFTWVEVLKKNRSYLLVLYRRMGCFRDFLPAEMKAFKASFKAFAQGIVQEGIRNGQVADRKYISDTYPDALWLETLFIFQFWLRDSSPGFERTDAAIEKSVHLAFDLMGRSAMDTFVDFAKFLYQSR